VLLNCASATSVIGDTFRSCEGLILIGQSTLATPAVGLSVSSLAQPCGGGKFELRLPTVAAAASRQTSA